MFPIIKLMQDLRVHGQASRFPRPAASNVHTPAERGRANGRLHASGVCVGLVNFNRHTKCVQVCPPETAATAVNVSGIPK